MSSAIESFNDGSSAEKGALERSRTPGGHLEDRTQPAMPVVHRRFGNPAPLGLLSFATSVFLICTTGLQARGVAHPNVIVGVMVFFGGVAQMIAGIMEFFIGNTFGGTLFMSYSSFNLSYAMVYLPGSGILEAYSDADGLPLPELSQALALYLWAWFIISIIFTIGATRSSWILFIDLVVLDVFIIILAVGNMQEDEALKRGAYSLGYVIAFLTYWAGAAGLWSGDTTAIKVPTFPMYKEKQ
ncbi:GPR1/FUN34/yaaH family-domain-containing protein [Xylariomycetidae sp. FL0641]|nr:GPR1/FUN34/yaaH family-domain-containing protein [Xylariomycetidae sp. FL0641]